MPATLERVRRVYAERALAMGEALHREIGDKISFTVPQGGLFFWARLTDKTPLNGTTLAQCAIEKGVAFVPGAPFYANNPDHATLRLSFATADVDKINQGISRLAQALA